MHPITSASVFRFAPSPTGYLHIGNARPALINALLALKHGATFILRLDDTDAERSTPQFAAAIEEDLAWLGIHWDRFERQSNRLSRYGQALDCLKARGLVYPAFETPDELERKRKLQATRGLPPIYDRAALRLSEDDRRRLEAEGVRPHWRLKLSGATARWEDGVRGDCHIETASLSDPVLVRADGTVLYTFASVVDDIDMGVTHVIRGEDHVANTAVQIELFAALGAADPSFAHHNLITTASGEEMSKRKGSLSLRSFREEGLDPMAVACVAVLTGTSEPVRPLPDLRALADHFALSKLSRALTKFDPQEIRQLSARLLHERPFSAVAGELAGLGIEGAKAEPFWQAVRGNLYRIEEAGDWWRIVTEPDAVADTQPSEDDRAFLSEAATLLPPDPLDQGSWDVWTAAIKQRTGRKGRALFMPLRLALTGREHGPELKNLLPLMGSSVCSYRLCGRSVSASPGS